MEPVTLFEVIKTDLSFLYWLVMQINQPDQKSICVYVFPEVRSYSATQD